VDFTKLEFPHLPAREKREAEIRLYKQKQSEASAVTDALDITERQPVFLKDKADALFKQRNYHAAVNAYSSAIAGEEEESMLALTCRCAALGYSPNMCRHTCCCLL
jgi:dyslexia susceptibility 1 candidate gene 1 protein